MAIGNTITSYLFRPMLSAIALVVLPQVLKCVTVALVCLLWGHLSPRADTETSKRQDGGMSGLLGLQILEPATWDTQSPLTWPGGPASLNLIYCFRLLPLFVCHSWPACRACHASHAPSAPRFKCHNSVAVVFIAKASPTFFFCFLHSLLFALI